MASKGFCVRSNGNDLLLRVKRTSSLLTSAALLYIALAGWCHAEQLWFVPPAANVTQQGFIRITNTAKTSNSISIYGIDDAGAKSPGTVSFTLEDSESKQLNSSDLEFGNPQKGMSGSLGHGTGNWRLSVTASGPITATALIRTTTGFLTSVQDPDQGKVQLSTKFTVPMMNPGSNTNQVSVLRVVNPSPRTAEVSISAFDDSGVRHPVQGFLALEIPPQQAVQLTSRDMEEGAAGKGLVGKMGAGVGKWRVSLSSNEAIKVLNLLHDPNGFISEIPVEGAVLSSVGYFSCENFEGAMLFSQDDIPVFLGFIGSKYAMNSINNLYGPYGSSYSTTSVRNTYSSYGSQFLP